MTVGKRHRILLSIYEPLSYEVNLPTGTGTSFLCGDMQGETNHYQQGRLHPIVVIVRR